MPVVPNSGSPASGSLTARCMEGCADRCTYNAQKRYYSNITGGRQLIEAQGVANEEEKQ